MVSKLCSDVAAADANKDTRLQAEEANSAKSQFLATMSHELRTPLNAIAGYTQLMALGIRGAITPEQREDLDRIDRSQRHLLSLINDILNFAKIEAGHVVIDMRDFDLHEAVETTDADMMGEFLDSLRAFGLEDTHSLANSLTWGPDGWLYGVHGSTSTARVRSRTGCGSIA